MTSVGAGLQSVVSDASGRLRIAAGQAGGGQYARAGTQVLLNGRVVTVDGIGRAAQKAGADVIAAIGIANKKASIALYGFVIRNFQQEGGMVGGWLPLSAQAIARKAKKGYRMMLQNTGALRNSFMPYSDEKVALVGSALHYSEDHQLGKDGHPPQRRILPNEEEAQARVMPIYGREVQIVTSKKW